jgi:hypothetical protein
MSAFSKASESVPIAPRKVIVLRQEHWASTFSDRPENPIQVGLRLLSIDDQDAIRHIANQASIEAITAGGDPKAAAQSAMLIATIARAICHQRDARRAHERFECADDLLPIALTKEALTWIFDELEKLVIESSPIFGESTDDEIVVLCDMLQNGAMARLTEADPTRAARVRRYLDFVLTEIEGV